MIVLIRHAETDMAGRFCGHSNPDLSLTGREQLDHIVRKVARMGIDRIWSSDLRRARQTADAIAQRMRTDVELRPRLREINFGAWEGLSWIEVSAGWPDEVGRWMREFPQRPAPGGERYADFAGRIEAEFDRLSRRPDGVTAVVTHRGVMVHTLTRLCGWDNDEAWEKTGAYGAVICADLTQSSEVRAEFEMGHCQGGSV